MTRGRLLGAAVVLSVVVAVGAASAAAPSVVTGSATAITATTATIAGTVDPNGVATTWQFEYGTSTGYGSQSPSTPQAAGSGTSPVAVSRGLTGLTGGVTYHYRLTATNADGTTVGSDETFTTIAPPAVVTGAASNVGPTQADVAGTVDPNGLATTWHVEYGTTTSYGTQTSPKSAGSGTSPVAVSAQLTGLQANRTYHYRLVGTSSAGTTNGADATFLSAAPPSATTGAATSITGTGAKLAGQVDPNGRATTFLFEYGPTTAYGSKTSSSSAGSGSDPVAVSKTLSGLTPGVTYHYRLVATSDAGTRSGADATFTTLSVPVVVTGPASSIGPTSARVGGTVNPSGASTTWYVEYGTTTSYGGRTSSRKAGSGTTPTNVSVTLGGLTSGTTFHYRLVATNSRGTTRGADLTFTTAGGPSAVTGTVPLDGLSLRSAVVTGTANPRGVTTDTWFEYGRTTAYGNRTARTRAGAGSTDVGIRATLTGLAPGVRYHFRLVASSAAGTTVGRNASFATPPVPRDPRGRPLRCTIVGTQGSDTLRGTSGRDVICGLGGADRLYGGSGADILDGGPAVDLLDGGSGDDVLYGKAGADRLFGRGGRDLLDGGAGWDEILAGTGRDRCFGGDGNDAFSTRDGQQDTIDGGRGNDVATFDRGTDRLTRVERRR